MLISKRPARVVLFCEIDSLPPSDTLSGSPLKECQVKQGPEAIAKQITSLALRAERTRSVQARGLYADKVTALLRQLEQTKLAPAMRRRISNHLVTCGDALASMMVLGGLIKQTGRKLPRRAP